MSNLPLTAIAYPAKGSAGRTGLWRTERPVINYERCVKCLICWLYCPEPAVVRRGDDSVEIDYDYCKGCGICANECPAKAITMVEEVS
ncbi:MAG: 4Fe-4S binding protein [Thermofilaceae archaeon]|nr:4Fe-4S binding protein [Thermofilaceae archaeon]MCX8180074.1 4Fe-4S binding protein [Thermofilaceae archaeon]